jgi:arylsulfatase A-like enzyme
MKVTFLVLCAFTSLFPQANMPNIMWIIAEDASPHISCYGETTIQTPNLDALAAAGILFENAFVTNPVCSPSRSALVAGMYQTTLGAHNHRSQRSSGKGQTSEKYFDSYKLPENIQLVSDLFREAGYYTCNGDGPEGHKKGKQDYNFIANNIYDGINWKECPADKPFFAQIQLDGGKKRSSIIEDISFSIPPYYPDHPVVREDWARYLGSWIEVDNQIGQIISQLDSAGVLDNTIIFFLTDHGISHLRGKQFLYEEGIRVPLIIKFPEKYKLKNVRSDLVKQIDITATSLVLAGIDIPDYMSGQDLFASNYKPQEYIISARDRCDETIDIIRSVRTKNYKYIRNFMPFRPHAQPNQYKDDKEVIRTIRQLFRQNQLNELQSSMFITPRPAEELYDLQNDPFETTNLAGDADYKDDVIHFRKYLSEWMIDHKDLGLIPEPILEDMGRKYGNKYYIPSNPANKDLIKHLLAISDAGRDKDIETLVKALSSERASMRYWAATWCGYAFNKNQEKKLIQMTKDKTAVVRIAAALALCKNGHYNNLQIIIDEVNSPNLLTGMYAINAIEQTGILDERIVPATRQALDSPYEFTRRYGKRLRAKLQQKGHWAD